MLLLYEAGQLPRVRGQLCDGHEVNKVLGGLGHLPGEKVKQWCEQLGPDFEDIQVCSLARDCILKMTEENLNFIRE